VFTLRFSDEGTLRNLKRTAAALGLSATELAEAAIERELALVGSDQEHRLTHTLERLKSAGLTGLDQDIENFARSELEVEDPLRSNRVNLNGQLHQIVDELVRRGLTLEQARREFERQFSVASELMRPRVAPATPAARKMPAANKSAGKRES
jgi:hypothetical protein